MINGYFLILLSTLLGASGVVLLKKNAQTSLLKILTFRAWKVYGALSLSFLGLLVYMASLDVLPVSIAYAATSVQHVWVVLLAVYWNKERLHVQQIFALLLLLSGVALVTLA